MSIVWSVASLGALSDAAAGAIYHLKEERLLAFEAATSALSTASIAVGPALFALGCSKVRSCALRTFSPTILLPEK